MHVRIETRILDGLRQIASREQRTPSYLARKLITDLVRGGRMEAVPPAPPVQSSQPMTAIAPRSFWDI